MQTKNAISVGVSVIGLATTITFLWANAQTRTYYIPSGSMMPNLKLGTRIQTKVNPYQTISEIKRGDIIVATRIEKGNRMDSIKRVIGLPGDKIAMNGTVLKINGRDLPHQLARKVGKISIYTETDGAAKYQVQYGDNTSPAAPYNGVVPYGQLFCLGDNRDNSYDSRYTGGVQFGEIVGKKVP